MSGLHPGAISNFPNGRKEHTTSYESLLCNVLKKERAVKTIQGTYTSG